MLPLQRQIEPDGLRAAAWNMLNCSDPQTRRRIPKEVDPLFSFPQRLERSEAVERLERFERASVVNGVASFFLEVAFSIQKTTSKLLNKI
jgi:hypothetical protein